MLWADTATALSAIGALVIATVSFIWSVLENRKTSGAIEKSAEAAAASARAAELSTSHFSRMADALEAFLSAEDAKAIAIASAFPTPAAAWEVSHIKGSKYELTNAGNGPAYEVEVAAPKAVRFDGPSMVAEWKPGESRPLLAIGSWQTGIPELHVAWRSTPVATEEQRWTRLLPKS